MISILSPIIALMMIGTLPESPADGKEVKEIKEIVALEFKDYKEPVAEAPIIEKEPWLSPRLGFPPIIPPTVRPLSE